MPRRYYKKKKRSFRRKRRGRSSNTRKLTTLPLGKKFKFNTRYVETQGVIDPPLSAAATDVYSLNGLFDPDFTGGGHQPIGFDQIMAMYDHYTVIGAKVTVRITNNDTTQVARVIAQVKDRNTVTNTLSQMNTVIENGACVWKVLGPLGSGTETQTLRIGCNLSKAFGRSVMDGDKYWGNVGANPADQQFLHLIAYGDGILENLAALTYVIQIDYAAVMTEAVQLAGS